MFAARLPQFITAFFVLLAVSWPACAAFAVELGDLTVDSHVGEILVARIEILGEMTELPVVRIAAPEIFHDKHVRRYPFHERLVVELVPSASSPYVVLRSIGFIERQNFGLVLAVTQNGQVGYTTYRVTLKPRVFLSGLASPEEILSAPEMLSVLVVQLGSNGKVPAVAIFTELMRINGDHDGEDGVKVPVLRMTNEPETGFINGLLALMTPTERRRFDSLSASLNTRRDLILELLFDSPGGLLGRLLREGQHVKEFPSRQGQLTLLKQARENNFALQNKVLALQSQLDILRKQRMPETEPSGDMESSGVDFQFFQEGWPVLLTRRPWQVLAAVTFVLTLIALGLWLRVRRKSSRMSSRKTPGLW